MIQLVNTIKAVLHSECKTFSNFELGAVTRVSGVKSETDCYLSSRRVKISI